ncbi:MAG: tRNA (N6-threonylcarbamoyladenosine(37)-N6)-methyltransferase TrmO [Syntrophales bacterium]|jgi:tRNA-Thr(GGU) m(6)t(6)A37 methyltransferase TsaA|nr:tRNA (N6-threonylcarbamoyladenosine(37)-N6)-methyltransferase TrmO [Syntrophales bacterium]MCK9393114.1 tRNA (N6-threonylcarbamoyladenosine(37)-N6)-methyltransferase TrmO [Syntrophales bacterium]
MTIYQPIGVIHSPFRDQEGMPIQPMGAQGTPGWIEINDDYTEGLRDLEGFSHIILLYHFHLSNGFDIELTPFLDDTKRGVFATRAPRRPNPIGLSVVKLVGIEGKILKIENMDIVDGTPLLDIKPYIPAFDIVADATSGWFEGKEKRIGNIRADDRFSKENG